VRRPREVSFAGFASVVAIFQARWSQRTTPFDLFRFWVMLAFSLATLLFALIPFALHFLGLGEAAVWRTSSALLALFVIGNAAFIVSLVRRRVPSVVSSLTPWISVFANVTYAVSIGAQLANVFGLLGGPTFGLYFLGLLILLLGAGVNFAPLVWVGSAELVPPGAS
jgi:hypothetical protein